MADISSSVVGNGSDGGNNQSDPVGSFSFDKLHEQAMAFDEGTQAQPEQPTQQKVDAQPQQSVTNQEPVDAAKNVDTATAKQIAQLKDDDLVEITVDGEAQQMTWKEAKGFTMRQAKFTKEMQTLRKQQEEFETERGSLTTARSEREALVTLLKNENLLKEFLQKKYPHLVSQAKEAAQEQVNVSPDDIASVGQVDKIARAYAENVASLVEELKADLANRLEQVTVQIEDRQATAKLSGEITHTIKGLFQEHPYILKVVPNAEQMLRYEVLQMQPSTAEETLEAFKQVFGGWVENYKSVVGETNKQNVIQKQKLVNNNIQPPGGTAVQPQPSSFKTKDGKVDWDKLREAAMSML